MFIDYFCHKGSCVKILLAIGTGSFAGGVLRYLISGFIQAKFLSSFPFGTLMVNLAGCFLIGVVFGISERGQLSPEIRLFLTTGFLGGFTTFSAFSNETVALLRDGQLGFAGLYIIGSVGIGVIATILGIALTKLF
jgi:CrcB protein